MAWARVCASCCQQLAEAVLPTTGVGGAEERTPLLSLAPASLPPMPSIQRGPDTPNSGFLFSSNGFTSSDPFSEVCGEVGLSVSSSFQGPEASGASWPSVALLPDLEEKERQGECALPRAAPAGLAPLKPEASWSSSPEPTNCITTVIEAETGTRDRGSIGPGPGPGPGSGPGSGPGQGSWRPYCHGSSETPEPRRGQLLTVPGGLWGCADPGTNQKTTFTSPVVGRLSGPPGGKRARVDCPGGEEALKNIVLNLTIPRAHVPGLRQKGWGSFCLSLLTPLPSTANM